MHKSSLIILLLAVITAAPAFADEVLLKDPLNRPTWRIINTANFAKVEKKVLYIDNDKQYFRAIPNTVLFGSKVKLQVTNLDSTPYKLGILVYGKKPVRHFSKELTGTGEFIFELPENSKSLGMLIVGKGRYKNISLTRISDINYTLVPYPSYQMCSGKPEPVSFNLFHKGKLVENAEITENGLNAVHRPSGAVARAYIVKADTAKFDAVAKNIKLKEKHCILYLGDSLSHFDLGFNHVNKLEYFLNKYNPDQVSIYNYACGGDDIVRIVERLNGKARGKYKNRYIDLATRKYDTAFVFLGHNDTKASSGKNYKVPVITPAKQRKYYTLLFAKLKTLGVKNVILVSSTSSNYEICQKVKSLKRVHNMFGIPEHQENFNKVLQQLAKENSFHYMDVYTPMVKVGQQAKAKLLNPRDGVHLSPAGHDFIALKTLEFLQASQALR